MGCSDLRRHIWGYSVCLCPIKRMPGLYGLLLSYRISENCGILRYVFWQCVSMLISLMQLCLVVMMIDMPFRYEQQHKKTCVWVYDHVRNRLCSHRGCLTLEISAIKIKQILLSRQRKIKLFFIFVFSQMLIAGFLMIQLVYIYIMIL